MKTVELSDSAKFKLKCLKFGATAQGISGTATCSINTLTIKELHACKHKEKPYY